MNLTPEEYRKAAADFTIIVGEQPLRGMLKTTALACREARAALMRAGNTDEGLYQDLLNLQHRLEQEAHE